MKIPVELVENIEKGNCVLFLGWGGALNGESNLSLVLNETVLSKRLADRIHYTGPVGRLDDVAERFQVERGRNALIQFVCEVVEEYSEHPPFYYKMVASLPFNIIVVTTLENFLEMNLREQGKRFIKVIREEDIPFVDDDKVLLVKLYGDIDNKSSIVITQDDFIGFFDQLPSISTVLKYYFSTKSLLFLGYDLSDSHFLRLYTYANKITKGYQRRAFLIKKESSEYEKKLWDQRNLTILETSTEEFLSELERSIVNRRLPPKDVITSNVHLEESNNPVHKTPYKFLSNFEEQDADIFFGREHDVVQATQKLLSSRIMVLCGKSGIGKTSLLLAGITPRLIRNNYLPVYARCAGDPLSSIKRNTIDRIHQLRNAKPQEAKDESGDLLPLPLADFLRRICAVTNGPLVIFLDQFEEFFISLGDATRRQFEKEVADCIESPYIEAIFLFSLREDFLAELDELKGLRNIFENIYRLKALADKSARDSIIEPAKKFNITFEEGLVDQLLMELSQKGQVDPAQLQIVCDRLYSEMEPSEGRISTGLYEKTGGVKKILADYVDSIMDTLTLTRRSVAQQLLRGMVTSSYTRATLPYSDALLETSGLQNWHENDTRELLNDLERMRLIRRSVEFGEESYELTHEYLINKIREWIDQQTMRVKEAQDMLRQEMNNWQRHDIRMSLAAMKIINAQREQLAMNNDSIALIMGACIDYDFEFEYWLHRVKGIQQAIKLILQILNDGKPEARRLAGIALGQLTKDVQMLAGVYATYASVANPSVVKRIEAMISSGFSFEPDFVKQVSEIVESRFTKDMVLVESGEYIMGVSKDEIAMIAQKEQLSLAFFRAQNSVSKGSLDSFFIDKYLVTNSEFQEFKPNHTFPAGHEDHPATHVTWFEAEEYARWVGKELPTEQEWEKTARGPMGFRFPWGDEWDPARCNTKLSGYGGTTPVKEFPTGISPYGCYDMAGNVWEWTSDWLDSNKSRKVLKGGSWSEYGILPWTWYRFNYQPESGYSNVGFRCVRRVRGKM